MEDLDEHLSRVEAKVRDLGKLGAKAVAKPRIPDATKEPAVDRALLMAMVFVYQQDEMNTDVELAGKLMTLLRRNADNEDVANIMRRHVESVYTELREYEIAVQRR